MSQELHYTSSPRGLKAGSRGFCTVACTAGLSPTLAERLEGLSGYRPKYPPHHPEAALNPVNWSHLRLSAGSQSASVLARVGPAGLDYTDRPNKYAHHVVLESGERAVCGPAWMLAQPSFMEASWRGSPQVLPVGRRPPAGDRPASVCRAWQDRVGDAGWAGVVAESFLADPKRPAIFVYDPGIDVLNLFVETLALLPADRRWEVTFCTFYTGLPAGTTCAWRGVLRDSPEERQARANPEALILDLGQALGTAQGGALVNAARTGEPVEFLPPTRAAFSPPRENHPPSLRVATAAAPAAQQAAYAPESGGEYLMAPPPLASRARAKAPTAKASQPPRSVWPLVAALAGAFLIGGVIGGAGVAYVLSGSRDVPVVALVARTEEPRAKSPSSEKPGSKSSPTPLQDSKKDAPNHGKGDKVTATVQQAGGSKPPSDSTTPPRPADQERPKTNETGSIGQPPVASQTSSKEQSGNQSPISNTSTPAPGSPKLTEPPPPPPTPRPASPKTTEPTPQPPTPTPASGSPSVTEPTPLRFISIPQGIPDSASVGGSSERLTMDSPIRRLKLIGLKDKAIEQYNFSEKQPAEHQELTITTATNKGIQENACRFSWEGKKINFRWLGSFEQEKYKEKNAIRDCILAVELANGATLYYLLWDPKIKLLPAKLNGLKKHNSTQHTDDNLSLYFPWYDTDRTRTENTASRRIPQMFSLKFFKNDDLIIALARKKPAIIPYQRESSVTIASNDDFAKAETVGPFREEIRITLKQPTEKQLEALEASINKSSAMGGNVVESEAEKRTDVQPSDERSTSNHAKNSDTKQRFINAKQRAALGNKILGARMEARITIEVEGREYLLPVLTSEEGAQ